MVKRRKKKRMSWSAFIVLAVLLFASIGFQYWAAGQRAKAGFFDDPFWITIHDISDAITTALLIGIVIERVMAVIKSLGG